MYKVKLASEASQWNFAFLTTKYETIAKLEHLVCPKVGGAYNPLVPPTFESVSEGAHASAAPFSYALDPVIMCHYLEVICRF